MRVCLVGEGDDGGDGGDDGAGGICEANHDAASWMLSSVCPESMCHATPGSRRISQRPGQRTCSRPRVNSGGSSTSGSIAGLSGSF